MLQAVRTIPSTCSQRIAELNQTIWTQLDNNEWLFVAPKPEVLTVLCSRHEPSDVTLIDTGKLKLNNMCKWYGTRILIQAHLTISTNNTDKDIIPHLPLVYDCCVVQGTNFSLNIIHLNLPLNNVIHHLDDLKVANHKVEEVKRLNEEQDWKLRHSNIQLVLYKHLIRVSCNISSSFNKSRDYLHIIVSCCELGFQSLSVPTHSRLPSRPTQFHILHSQPTIAFGIQKCVTEYP
jgi:hypothetical protein